MTGQDIARQMREEMSPEQLLDRAREAATLARRRAAQTEDEFAEALTRYNESLR